MSNDQLYRRLLVELIKAGELKKSYDRQLGRIRDLERRINTAMDQCEVCSKKSGSPDLCDRCLKLRGTLDEYGDYTGPER